MKYEKCIIGLDVGKEKNDYVVLADGIVIESGKVPNSANGVAKIVQLSKQYDAPVAMAFAGTYEFLFRDALLQADITCLKVEPYTVRKYAQARYCNGRNDQPDAKVIAEFVNDNGAVPYDVSGLAQTRLRNSWAMCKKYKDLLVSVKNDRPWLPTLEGEEVMQEAKERLEKGYDYFYKLCQQIIKSDTRMSGIYDRFLSVKGIGSKTAVAVLAFFPEIGTVSDSQAAAFVGIAPVEHSGDSGRNGRHIGRGRAMIREEIYMAALSAVRCNSILRTYYKRKIEDGHAAKWIVVPVMRKLLHLMNKIAGTPGFVPYDDAVSSSSEGASK